MKKINNILYTIFSFIAYSSGYFIYFLFPLKVCILYRILQGKFYTGFYKNRFKFLGGKSVIYPLRAYRKLSNVVIGHHTLIEKDALIRCFQNNRGSEGKIIIGNYVEIGLNANISSCEMITIGDGVLMGRNVMINDNSHGYTNNRENLALPPKERPIVSKGSIIINNNVWIGENVVILGKVTIGEGVIIGANSVVTKDIPAFSIVAGCPATIIKSL